MLLSNWSSCMNCMYLEKKWHFIYKNSVGQRCRNAGCLVAQVNKFYVALHHISSCHLFGTSNFELTPRHLKKLWTLAVSAKCLIFFIYLNYNPYSIFSYWTDFSLLSNFLTNVWLLWLKFMSLLPMYTLFMYIFVSANDVSTSGVWLWVE
jgi:hypothetical protein